MEVRLQEEDRKFLKEKIRYNTELIKLLWLLLLATLTGLATLLFNWPGFTGRPIILLFVCFMSTFVIAFVIYQMHIKTSKLINRLNE